MFLNEHTQTRLMALFPGLPGWAGNRKVKPIWILLKQETVSGSRAYHVGGNGGKLPPLGPRGNFPFIGGNY